MGTVTLTLNPEPYLRQRTEASLKRAVQDLDGALRKEFTNPVWGWPGQTIRQNGTTASSPRNIVDTGALLASQRPPRQITPLHYRIEWTADYAAAVFLGAVFKKRRSSLPARNVAFGAFQTFNLAASIARYWRS